MKLEVKPCESKGIEHLLPLFHIWDSFALSKGRQVAFTWLGYCFQPFLADRLLDDLFQNFSRNWSYVDWPAISFIFQPVEYSHYIWPFPVFCNFICLPEIPGDSCWWTSAYLKTSNFSNLHSAHVLLHCSAAFNCVNSVHLVIPINEPTKALHISALTLNCWLLWNCVPTSTSLLPETAVSQTPGVPCLLLP